MARPKKFLRPGQAINPHGPNKTPRENAKSGGGNGRADKGFKGKAGDGAGAGASGNGGGSGRGAKEGASSGAGGAGEKRKRGFQVGPAHAPRNAYLGKVKKIKDDLITKARLKKQYAKVLKETGGTSERLQRRGRGGDGDGDGDGDAASKDVDGGDEDAGPGDRNKSAAEDRGGLKRKRSAGDEEAQNGRTTKIKGKDASSRLGKDGKDVSASAGSSTDPHPRKTRALSPSDISPPMAQTSLRDLKKEAFKKYHPVRAGGSASLRGKGIGEGGLGGGFRRASGMSRMSGMGGGGSGPPGMGKGRGQPNMAARMGVLLEKIRRDKA